MNGFEIIPVITLLLQLGCKEENLGDTLRYLSGGIVPETVEEILSEARRAIHFVEDRKAPKQ